MVRWRIGLAGALALVASAPVWAQLPEPPAGTANFVIVDGRIGDEAMAAVRRTLEEPELSPVTLLTQAGGCGVQFTHASVKSETGASPSGSAPPQPFDLDMALRSAAGPDGQTAPSSILLIAQGPSNCLSIGCALAASLADQYNEIRINVVGLSDAASSLACLAANTGAQFRHASIDNLPAAIKALLPKESVPAAASDARSTPGTEAANAGAAGAAEESDRKDNAETPAASEQVAETKNRENYPPLPKPRPDRADGTRQVRADDSAPKDAEKAEQPEQVEPFKWAAAAPGAPESEQLPALGKPGALIRVLAGPRGPLVESQLAFEILSADGDGTFRRVAHSNMPNPFFPLPAGRYVARIVHGEVVREFPFSVNSDTADLHTFSLDLGYLNLQALPSATAAPLESGIVYSVYQINGGTSGKPIVTRTESQPMIALPAGNYQILASLDAAKIVADVEITAGETVQHQFDFDLGYLRVTVNSDADNIDLRIERPYGGTPNGTAPVMAEHQGSSALFRLPAGHYNALAFVEGGRARQSVTVEQGKLTTVVLKLQTAAHEPPQQ